jgi:hypothetical protein
MEMRTQKHLRNTETCGKGSRNALLRQQLLGEHPSPKKSLTQDSKLIEHATATYLACTQSAGMSFAGSALHRQHHVAARCIPHCAGDAPV